MFKILKIKNKEIIKETKMKFKKIVDNLVKVFSIIFKTLLFLLATFLFLSIFFLPLVYILFIKIKNCELLNIYEYVKTEKFLSYYASVCVGIGTTFLGIVTLWQNNKLSKENARNKVYPNIKIIWIKKENDDVFKVKIKNCGVGIANSICFGNPKKLVLDSLLTTKTEIIYITNKSKRKSKYIMYIKGLNIEKFDVVYNDCYDNTLKTVCYKNGRIYKMQNPNYEK